jgi:nitrogen fixation protein
MNDTFRKHTRSLTSPPEHGAAVVPGTDLAHVTRALYVGGGGNLAVRLQDGTELTLANMPAGTLLPIRVTRILATGTTATEIVGLW